LGCLFSTGAFAQTSSDDVCKVCEHIGVDGVFIIPNDGVFMCLDDNNCLKIYALPIELVSFDAKLVNNDIEIDWVTASETNNAGYEIQRSIDGKNFDVIETVAGAGTTEQTQTYTSSDRDIKNKTLTTTVYYRLKQMDFDGTVAFTETVAVELGRENQLALRGIIASDRSGNTSVKYNAPTSRQVSISVFDLSGKVLNTLNVTAEKGLNETQLDLSDLQSGFYVITLDDGRTISSDKFIK